MAHLPGYEHDVFVSYAHIDPDHTDASFMMQWAKSFVDWLERDIRSAPGGQPGFRIFLDQDALNRTAPLTSALEHPVAHSAILLTLMSDEYLKSSWCRSEARWFAEAARRRTPAIDDASLAANTLVARVGPVSDGHAWPDFLRDSGGHTPAGFYLHGPTGKSGRHHRPHGWPCIAGPLLPRQMESEYQRLREHLLDRLDALSGLAPARATSSSAVASMGSPTPSPTTDAPVPSITVAAPTPTPAPVVRLRSEPPYPVALPPQPYPGLRPFESSEWSVFLGREAEIETIIDRLDTHRLIVVHGSSGAGKSSLIRAGVFPRLAWATARAGDDWRTAIMRPSGGPLRNLALALATIEERADDKARVRALEMRLREPAAQLAAIVDTLEGTRDRRVCLLVDQFEEIFAPPAGDNEADTKAFIALLAGLLATRRDASRLRVIVTMRSEFIGDCARFEGLAEAMNTAQYLLPRMSREALDLAIRRPAELFGGEVDESLADLLINDVRGNSDELPLIQHGLSRLWQSAQAGISGAPEIGLDAYARDGPLATMLSAHADTILASVAPDGSREAHIAEAMFRALIDTNAEGQAIRRPRTFGALRAVAAPEDGDADRLTAIVEAFRVRDAAFLTPLAGTPIGDDTVIDIGHEALIRCWTCIADLKTGWLAREFGDGLIWRSLLVQAVSFAGNRENLLSEATTADRDTWLTGRAPAWAERYGGQRTLVDALMAASRRARDRARRFRNIVQVALFAGLTILASLTWFAYTANQRALAKESLLLARLAHVVLPPDGSAQPVTAIQLALAGLPGSGTAIERVLRGLHPAAPEATGVLAEALARQRELAVLQGHTDTVRSAVFSPDGARLLTASWDTTPPGCGTPPAAANWPSCKATRKRSAARCFRPMAPGC